MKWGLAIYYTVLNSTVVAESNNKKELKKVGEAMKKEHNYRYEIVEMKYHQD